MIIPLLCYGEKQMWRECSGVFLPAFYQTLIHPHILDVKIVKHYVRLSRVTVCFGL